jgi:CheY-like chemotaxis protein
MQERPPMPQARPEEKPVTQAPAWQLNRQKIVVAHDGESVRVLIKGLLDEAGYETITASEGIEAMIAIEREKPFMVILDVALPRIYGFEICDRLKNNAESKDIKIILIASIYDKTRYKREPMSLYGADDYIEKHHIQDCIVDKVRRVSNLHDVPGFKSTAREEEFCSPPPSEEVPVRMKQAEEMRTEEMRVAPAPTPATPPPAAEPQPTVSADPQLVEAARRFSRIIFSDIALYNQAAIEEGVRNGNLRELLAAELKEGRDLYNGRVSEEVRATMDYFDDELNKFIEKKKSMLELGG